MSIIRLQGEAERRRGIYYEVNTAYAPIGEGGMGIVRCGICVDERTKSTRPVAIKFIYADLQPEFIERARREASIQLRSDNLIEMLGFIEVDEPQPIGLPVKRYHVVSELLNGISLDQLMQGNTKDSAGRDIPFAVKMLQDYKNDPEHFAQIIVMNVLSGLMALHDAGYIHRDIDPSNIMITADGHIKLIDFGIAKRMNNLTTGDKQLTIGGMFMGKPEYAAPELVLGDVKQQNQTTDLYAMGILLYQCITGHTPFEGARADILQKQLKNKLPLKAIKNKDLRNIIATACEKKQDMRYQTAAQMRVALEALQGHEMKTGNTSKKMVIVTASAAAVLALTVIILMMKGNNTTQPENQGIAGLTQEDSVISAKQEVVQLSPEVLYEKALAMMNSQDAQELKQGIAIMDSLSNTLYVPAIYEMGFTYGWFSDSVSVTRKKLLGIETDKHNLPLQDKYNTMAIAYLTRMLEQNDSTCATLNAKASYCMSLYYINPNKLYKVSGEKAIFFLQKSKEWALVAKDNDMAAKIEIAINNIRTR